MKKNNIYFLSFIFFLSGIGNSFSQNTAKIDYDNAKAVKESKFMVVLNDVETAIDDSVKSAMKKYWTFCDYDFIKASEYDTYKKEDGYSFMALMSEAFQGLDINGYAYRIVFDAKKNKNLVSGFVSRVMMPTIKNEKKNIVLNTYDYLIPYIIKTLQTELDENFKSNGKAVKYNRSKEDMGDDKKIYRVGGYAKFKKMNQLLLCKDGVKDIEAAKNMVKKIFDVDTSKVSFVSSAEISKAISEKKDNIAIVYADFNGNCEVFTAANLEPLATGWGLFIWNYGKNK